MAGAPDHQFTNTNNPRFYQNGINRTAQEPRLSYVNIMSQPPVFNPLPTFPGLLPGVGSGWNYRQYRQMPYAGPPAPRKMNYNGILSHQGE